MAYIFQFKKGDRVELNDKGKKKFCASDIIADIENAEVIDIATRNDVTQNHEYRLRVAGGRFVYINGADLKLIDDGKSLTLNIQTTLEEIETQKAIIETATKRIEQLKAQLTEKIANL